MLKIDKPFAAIAAIVTSCVILLSPHAHAQTSDATKSDTRKANWGLEKNVLKALAKNRIDTSNVLVKARNGAVVLGGSVLNASDIDAAVKVAASVPGVTAVRNALTVREGGS
jgi:hyperosmotically inducible periplasmic protein